MRFLELGLRIPLCRLVPLPRVRPMQEVDVRRLEVQFEDSDGYDDTDRALYVSIFNDKEATCDVGESIERLGVLTGIVLMKRSSWNLLPTMCMLL